MQPRLLLAIVVAASIGISPGLAGAKLIFQDGVNGYAGTKDTELDASHPSSPHGSLTTKTIDGNGPGDGDDHQGLLRFDDIFGFGPGKIPYDDFAAATLELYVTDRGDIIEMRKMMEPWDEDATWDTFGGIDDSEASLLRMVSIPYSGGYIAIDVTEELRDWADDPGSNHGWAFLPTDSNGVDFATSENELQYRPRLSVSFVPEPASALLFGFGLAGLGFMRRRFAA